MNKELHHNGFSQVYATEWSSGIKVEGFINVLNEEYYMQLYVNHGTFPKKVNLRGAWKFEELLRPVLKTLDQEQQLQTHKLNLSQQFSPPFQYYETVMMQLKLVGWKNIHSINDVLNVVELKASDSFRDHLLKICLPEHFPNEAPTYKYDLPAGFDFMWHSSKTLLDVYQHFQMLLLNYLDFWTLLEELDEYTWILEPEKPDHSTCKRRIAIAPTASILVVVNPDSPSAIPICNFLGPESIVKPFRVKFHENINQWEESLSLLTNFKNVLEIDFPGPETSTKNEYCVECGICYSHQLDGAIPDTICEEAKCQQPYHHTCLYEWLKSVPGARQSFSTVFGDCPYCTKPIWCTLHAG